MNSNHHPGTSSEFGSHESVSGYKDQGELPSHMHRGGQVMEQGVLRRLPPCKASLTLCSFLLLLWFSLCINWLINKPLDHRAGLSYPDHLT